MYLFQRLEYEHAKVKVEPYLIQASSYLDAMTKIATKNRFNDNSDLVKFIESRYDKVIDLMPIENPLFEKLEKQQGIKYWTDPLNTSNPPSVSLQEILLYGIEIGAITEAHLEKFILKSKEEDVSYYLKEIECENIYT